jgi:hypothetical protein
MVIGYPLGGFALLYMVIVRDFASVALPVTMMTSARAAADVTRLVAKAIEASNDLGDIKLDL